MSHNNEEIIPASISDNEYGCEFFFFNLSAKYLLEIIDMSQFLTC